MLNNLIGAAAQGCSVPAGRGWGGVGENKEQKDRYEIEEDKKDE